MTIIILILVAGLMILAERKWPNEPLPKVPGWWQRIILLNIVQAVVIVIAGIRWENRWNRIKPYRIQSSCKGHPF